MRYLVGYRIFHQKKPCLTLFRMDFLGAVQGWGGGGGGQKVPLSKICHAYVAMKKLGAIVPY